MEPQSDDIVIYDVLMVNRCCFKITVGEYMFLVPHWSLDLGFIGKQVISQSFVKKKKTHSWRMFTITLIEIDKILMKMYHKIHNFSLYCVFAFFVHVKSIEYYVI